MNCCSHCRDAEGFFSGWMTRRELARYRRKGPIKSTRLLVQALRAEGVSGATLLDVGGGIGAVQHELLDYGVGSATHVDASHTYLELAGEEAERRGHADRVARRYGDFVELASELPTAELVALDRVVCCYPHLEALLDAAAGRTRRVLGLVYPRKWWGVGVGFALTNLFLRLRRSDFRVYLHPPERIEELLRERGLPPSRSDRTWLWEVVTYRREA